MGRRTSFLTRPFGLPPHLLFGSLLILSAFGLWGGMLVPAPSVAAQGEMEGPTQAAQLALQERALSQGRIQVIVELDTEFSPVGELSTAAVEMQEERIARAQNRVLQQADAQHVRAVHNFAYIPYQVLEVDLEGLLLLNSMNTVLNVVEDRLEYLSLSSSVPNIQGDDVWNAGYTGTGQTIVVIDTGVDKNHAAFGYGSRVVEEACFSTTSFYYETESVCPGGSSSSTATGSGVDCVALAQSRGYPGAASDCTHGTHVAGIAVGDDGSNHRGVAPTANLIAIQAASLRTSTDSLTFFFSDLLAALEHVSTLERTTNHSIAAVNLSLGGNVEYATDCDSTEAPRKAAIDNLRSVGIATVVASGNEGFTNGISAPACISSAVSVGATYDGTDQIVDFSNVGNNLDLLAPGTFIQAALPGNTRGFKSGTSMAAPHVAGAWAVLREAAPNASVGEILTALSSSGMPIDDNIRYDATPLNNNGSGIQNIPRINIYGALLQLQPATATPTPLPTHTPTQTIVPTETTVAPTPTATATNTPPPPTHTPTASATSATAPSPTPTGTSVDIGLLTAVPTPDILETAPPATGTPTNTPVPTAPTSTPPPAATVVAEGTVTVRPDRPAELRLNVPNGSEIQLQVPAGAVEEEVTLQMRIFSAPTQPHGSLAFAGQSFDLSTLQQGRQSKGFVFLRPLQLKSVYPEVAIAGVDEASLAYYQLDLTTGQWVSDGITTVEQNPTENRLVVSFDRATDFALFGNTQRVYLPIVAQAN